MLDVPAATLVITPEVAFTVATAELEEEKLPTALLPAILNVVVPPRQIFCVPLKLPAVGAAPMTTDAVVLKELQPPEAAIVYVTV
jgi:hypothetical protein